MLYDIAALQAIYGANLTTRTGDTIYGFNSNTGYDAFTFTGPNARRISRSGMRGGVDTLDMSGLAVGTTLNLNEQAFSSAGIRADGGMMINNISIARGAVIENAVGGRGNDTLIGNAVGNVLRGNQGNDILNGGNGSDTAAYAGQGRVYDHPESGWLLERNRQQCCRRDGADTLVSIEFLRFADQTFALLDDLPFPALFAANLSQGKPLPRPTRSFWEELRPSLALSSSSRGTSPPISAPDLDPSSTTRTSSSTSQTPSSRAIQRRLRPSTPWRRRDAV